MQFDEIKEREIFEEHAFAQYFVSTIQRNSNIPSPKISGCLDFVNVNCKTKKQFTKRKSDGLYEIETLNAAWWGWKTALTKII